MEKLKRVLIMAGGTGGHVFPGLAIAKVMRENQIEVHWLGTEKGLEARVVPEAGIPIHFIAIGGLRGKNWKSLVLAPWRLSLAILQSIKIIRKVQPDVVIGFGGFVAGPGGLASRLLGKRLIIHEQNAKPGLTNKWLAYVAARVLEGFPNTFSLREKVVTIGNPVRNDIINLLPPSERFKDRDGRLHLLVLGGSLGAVALNEVVVRSLAQLPENERPFVKHQTGEKHYEAAAKAYADAHVDAEVIPFIRDMASAYEWADIVLCRAGASTIAELCVAGIGSILVPYPYAADDHQTENACYLVKNGAAIMVQQAELTETKLLDQLKSLTISKEKRLMMAQAAFKLAKTDAAEQVLKICEEICQ